MPDLAERRDEVESQLADLRQARGAAVLDGKQFDPAEVASLEAELAGLDAAEGELTRRGRLEAEKAFQAARAEHCERLAALRDKYLVEIGGAERACRNYADHLAAARAAADAMAECCHAITGTAAPAPLNRLELARRYACRLAAIMKASNGNRLGEIAWRVGFAKPGDDWTEIEAKILDGQLAALIGERTSNGKDD